MRRFAHHRQPMRQNPARPSVVGRSARRIFGRIAAALTVAACLATATAPLRADETPIPIKVVVVAMYEIGEVTGDTPGEYQFWVERRGLEPMPFPLGVRDLHLGDDGVLAVCTGGGVTNATATIMALGLDPRFDLSKSYWVIAGIAGGDPADVSLGTGAWADYVVDGDLLYEIDAREIPDGWPYGLIPLGAKAPNEKDTGWTVDTIVYRLNPDLVAWAYELTRAHPVADSSGIAEFRAQFEGYAAATEPPFVTIGGSLGASTYWHGEKLNDWANDWMRLHSGGESNFMMSNMEDNGTLTALARLGKTGRVDPNRVLVLRTASNFSMPRPGETAAWSTTAEYPENGRPALEAAYSLGSRVVDALVGNWDRYADTPPAPPTVAVD